MDDQDNAMMEIYAEDGTLVSKRPLMPEERQLSIISANRTGTYDNVSETHYLMKILKKWRESLLAKFLSSNSNKPGPGVYLSGL